MNLSKRLFAIATLVDIKSRVIDVGCDHAYLDIYLTQNNENECIAIDINKNALNKAIENINKYNLEEKIKTKLTNGLSGIKIKETDNIIISGMGTYTILEILKTNKLSNTLIISSNNNINLLRREIVKLGYIIDTEMFLIDKSKPYIIIKFIKGYKKYNKIDIEYGPILRYNLDYRNYLIKQNKNILKSISKRKIILRLKYIYKILFIKMLKKSKNQIL